MTFSMRRGIFLVFSNFQYGKTPLSLAFLPFCMGSFEVRVTVLNCEGSYQRSLSVHFNFIKFQILEIRPTCFQWTTTSLPHHYSLPQTSNPARDRDRPICFRLEFYLSRCNSCASRRKMKCFFIKWPTLPFEFLLKEST